MKVVAFNGSPRVNGNTAQSLRVVLAELEREGIETELVQLGGRRIFGCRGCHLCKERRDHRCVRQDDELNGFLEQVAGADGLLIGSPTYFANVTAEVKAFIDRCGCVSRANGGDLLRGKVGAAVVVSRRAGADFTYAAINFFFGISEMIIPCSSYWNMALAKEPGEVLSDAEGLRIFRTLGQNMASLLHKLHPAASPPDRR